MFKEDLFDLIMHRRLNVHLLYNTKYPLSLGYKAEEAEAICNAQTTHATLQETSCLYSVFVLQQPMLSTL